MPVPPSRAASCIAPSPVPGHPDHCRALSLAPRRAWPAALALLLVATGCATLSEEECRRGQWGEIGFADGRDGRDAAHLARHEKACADLGIRPDRAAWEAGRQAGLPLYCTPENAYEEGQQGRRLNPVCPAAIAPRLALANRQGLRSRQVRDEIAEARRQLAELSAAIAALPPGDPARPALAAQSARLRAELSLLRLDLLRAERF